MKRFLIFLCIVMFQVYLSADDEFGSSAEMNFAGEEKYPQIIFSGYVENTFSCEYDKKAEKESLLDYTRVRLNSSGKLNDNSDFAVGIVGRMYSGSTGINMTEYLPEEKQDDLNPFTAYIFSAEYENDIYIQEAFLTFYFDYFKIRPGRQKYYSGTGYAYNPTDFFNSKNPLDPGYETDGLDGILISFNLPAGAELECFYRTGYRFEDSDYQTCLKFSFFSTDAVLQYTGIILNRTDFEMADADAASIAADPSLYDSYSTDYRIHFIGGSISSDAAGIGLRAEGGYVMSSAETSEMTLDYDGNYEVLLAGFDYTFEMQLYIIMEYYRNGAGVNHEDDAGLNEIMANIAGETDSIVKDTLFTGVSYPVTDLADAAVYAIVGLRDRSVIINPVVNWSVFSGGMLEFSGIIPYGKKGSYTGSLPSGGFIRAKVSF
ncbi:MAG: hypothetical protein JW982_02250 [Spirochaetes bacterium]|nr:hypothetical protein [Spirochaetota bacterium]